MQTIRGWKDMERYGIETLTGEACGLGARILCDLDARGCKLIAKAYGIREDAFAEPWNHRAGHIHEHKGSIMLPHDDWIFLGVFALLDWGCHAVWECYASGGTGRIQYVDSLYGVTRDDSEDDNRLVKLVCRRAVSHRRWAYHGTAGDRNVHEMTGRVA